MADYVVGFHAIEEQLKQKPKRGTLYILHNSEKRNRVLINLAQQAKGITIEKISKERMEQLESSVDTRGALLQLHTPSRANKEITVKEFISKLKEGQNYLVLVLDQITDVHNLGAILRSADQFSVDLVIMPRHKSAKESATVKRISSGASDYVPVATVTNSVRELEELKKEGFWVYGADGGGTSLKETSFPLRTVIVMGSEGTGLGKLVTKTCDHIVAIPTTGNIDSLNVSVATGILLYEYRRQY
ncbi:MAG: 23S rRNA (guanosine(2251)-2'-O)-methyltransferase RlmB [Sphaerochaetaceae bacterium]|jgi:23S rRNA (guanosine2251-2'-O)-methyltransferase